MFINKAKDGLNNVCGKNIAVLRKNMELSQRQLADAISARGARYRQKRRSAHRVR